MTRTKSDTKGAKSDRAKKKIGGCLFGTDTLTALATIVGDAASGCTPNLNLQFLLALSLSTAEKYKHRDGIKIELLLMPKKISQYADYIKKNVFTLSNNTSQMPFTL